MAAPAMTLTNAAGSLLAPGALAASASTSFNVDAQARFEAQVQVGCTFGTVAATSGLQVQVYRRIGSGPTADTNPITQFTVPAVAATSPYQSIALGTGRYSVKLTNLDATNGLTSVQANSDTLDAIS